MFALSVREPWASCIMHHGKNVENRRWCPTYRGIIAIHASNTLDFFVGRGDDTLPRWPDVRNWLREHPGVVFPLTWTEARFMPGYVLGTAVLSAVTSCDTPGPWALPDNYHWHLTDIRPFRRPFRYPGKQRLFEIPNSLVKGAQ